MDVAILAFLACFFFIMIGIAGFIFIYKKDDVSTPTPTTEEDTTTTEEDTTTTEEDTTTTEEDTTTPTHSISMIYNSSSEEGQCRGTIISSSTAHDLSSCQVSCNSKGKCVGYDWNSETNKCNIYSSLKTLFGDEVEKTVCMYNNLVWTLSDSTASVYIGNMSSTYVRGKKSGLTITLIPPLGFTKFNNYTYSYTLTDVNSGNKPSFIIKSDNSTIFNDNVPPKDEPPGGWPDSVITKNKFGSFSVPNTFTITLVLYPGMNATITNVIFSISNTSLTTPPLTTVPPLTTSPVAAAPASVDSSSAAAAAPASVDSSSAAVAAPASVDSSSAAAAAVPVVTTTVPKAPAVPAGPPYYCYYKQSCPGGYYCPVNPDDSKSGTTRRKCSTKSSDKWKAPPVSPFGRGRGRGLLW